MIFWEAIKNILFPQKCVSCGRNGILICVSCKNKIPSANTPEYGFIMSVFGYGHPAIRRLVHLLKYGNGRYVARFFAPYLAGTLTEFLGEEKLFHGDAIVLLVPVPLSKHRLKKRGYNQSELMINEMLKILPKGRFELDKKLVVKVKDTIPQAEIKKKSLRLVNQKDCFCVLPHNRKRNEVVVIVDDVTTTGATLCALRVKLLADGFRKVYALTVAH